MTAMGKFVGRSWVDVASVTESELRYFLALSTTVKAAIKERRTAVYRLAGDRDLFAALLFSEPSTRTRNSFELAAQRLGLRTVGFAGTEATSVKKGESLLDTVDMFDSYGVDAVILRHPLDGAARAVAENLSGEERSVCCFNGGDGMNEHPTQGLLDVFTIGECCGRLHDLEIGIAVDPKYGRTTHSFPVLLGLFPDNRFHVFSHPDLRMPKAVIRHLADRGVEVREYFDSGEQLREKLPDLDFLYMTRLQRERFEDDAEYYRARDMYLFTPEMMELTRPHFGVGHPLPDNKEFPTISPALKRHPKFWPKRQAGNGVPTRLVEIALSLGLMGADFDGEVYHPAPVDLSFSQERPVDGEKPRPGPVDIRPIDNGTVIDHIEGNPYVIDKISRLLGLAARGTIFRMGVVAPLRRPGSRKGVVMIKDRLLDDEEMRLIATLAPGSTVNDIREGHVVRKRDLFLPGLVEGLPDMQCTNHRCITRHEHHEHVPARALRLGAGTDSRIVKCFYCNNLMESHEVL
ncbi:MAG: aspartate carbamoyltransferase [Deltaproteobacteria bacterium]|nr:aspartate carbamoyltransferase [Deltaproteobacteria bacterium]